jgi:hypothetical protein
VVPELLAAPEVRVDAVGDKCDYRPLVSAH